MILSRSTWEKLKGKPQLQFSFIAIRLGWNLYFIIAFISESPMSWLTSSVSLYWGIPRFVMILEKNSFRTDAMLLSFSKMLSSSSRVMFSSEITLFDNKGLTTPQDFLWSHKCFSFIFPKKFSLFDNLSISLKKRLCSGSDFYISKDKDLYNISPFIIKALWKVFEPRVFLNFRVRNKKTAISETGRWFHN